VEKEEWKKTIASIWKPVEMEAEIPEAWVAWAPQVVQSMAKKPSTHAITVSL
jgi:hypothetical protein